MHPIAEFTTNMPYFLKISPRWDFISRLCLMRQLFKNSVYRNQHALSFNKKPFVCTTMCVRMHILSQSILYHVARFQGQRLLGWVGWCMQWHFEDGGISRCGKISRKYSIYRPTLLRLQDSVPPTHIKLLRTPIHCNMFYACDRAREIKLTTNWVRDSPKYPFEPYVKS